MAALLLALLSGSPAARAADRAFKAGSLIIPMDLAYQDTGMLQAYGLVFQLLRQGVPVYWVIAPGKTWHAADCDTPGDECAWDCAVEGSAIKCPYPTASPDFFASTKVVSDGQGLMSPGDAIPSHGYRGGPFVVESGDRDAALAIIEAWNDQALWGDAPWASRAVFEVVTVHEATASFSANVAKEMVAAPTIAVFADGNENIATSYLRAAGIPQSNGLEFPAAKCGNADCGPGTANPDMLTEQSIMGDMGTCDDVDYDHKNGSLFTADGVPAYCQIMSMHWNVSDRELVQCNGGNCPATQAECSGETITYNGHEVVAEVRSFLTYPTHFFAECQAVNAYENTVPNPSWPHLDDEGRRGHFLTTEGTPPACPCTDADFQCVAGGCNGVDCCLPANDRELGAGLLIAAQPSSQDLQILRPDVPYNQMDGSFATTGGSEPAYNLSAYLGTGYINARSVTFITGPDGPGDQDVWMTGYVDGECDIGGNDIPLTPQHCNGGKVSYLGGHAYGTKTPLSSNPGSQGARLFLNALFEADCVTAAGQPALSTSLEGDRVVAAQSVPVERDYQVGYANSGRGLALDGVLSNLVPGGVQVTSTAGATALDNGIEWTIGSIGANPVQAGDPPASGSRSATLEFPGYGSYDVQVKLAYRVGATHEEVSQTFRILVAPDDDGDGVVNDDDPAPDDPKRCGDSDDDTCDDCSVTGTFDPANDGPDADGDGICDAGESAAPGEAQDGGAGGAGADAGAVGCGCQSSGRGAPATLLLLLGGLLLGKRRRS